MPPAVAISRSLHSVRLVRHLRRRRHRLDRVPSARRRTKSAAHQGPRQFRSAQGTRLAVTAELSRARARRGGHDDQGVW
eukprot:COSAG01_NODE_6751_length_3515_cov_3.095141_3_plen_79_part_00